MDHFNYRGTALYAEDVPLEQIAAEFGTPCYVYSRATLERHWHAFDRAFAGQVLNVLARLKDGAEALRSLGAETTATMATTPLLLREPPRADVQRYDELRIASTAGTTNTPSISNPEERT